MLVNKCLRHEDQNNKRSGCDDHGNPARERSDTGAATFASSKRLRSRTPRNGRLLKNRRRSSARLRRIGVAVRGARG